MLMDTGRLSVTEKGYRSNSIGRLLEMLNSTNHELMQLSEAVDCGILSSIEAESQREILAKKQLNIKQKLCATCHVGREGQPLKIPSEPNFRGNLYRVKYPDGTCDTSLSYEGLLDKILKHYDISTSDFSFGSIWKSAMSSYERKHPGKDKTILLKKHDFTRYIDDELSSMDIRKIDASYLEDYSLKLITKKQLRCSAFRDFKGVINLVFDYAMQHKAYGVYVNPGKLMDNKNCLQYCRNTIANRKACDVMYTPEETAQILQELQKRLYRKPCKGYYVPYFAFRLQRATGMRPGEIFPLTWDDIVSTDDGDVIMIFKSQQEHRLKDGETHLWFGNVDFTKNEKGISKGGREFPVTDEIAQLFEDIRKAQKEAGIHSEYIICGYDGGCCRKKVYSDALTAVCKKLNLPLLGSYSLRREMNCRMERSGIIPSERAELLGHSVETNQGWYTFASHDVTKRARNRLNSGISEHQNTLVTPSNTKILDFSQKKKARKPS